MKSIFLRRMGISFVPVLGLAAVAALGGCSGGEIESAIDLGTPAPSSEVVGDYIMHVQPSKGRVTLHRLSKAAVEAQASHRGPGFSPQAMIDAQLTQDGVIGSNNGSTSNNTVELVTTTTVDTYGTGAMGSCPASSFCADVTLNSFWTKTLNNTFVQVTSIVDSSGQPFSVSHAATNSDSPRSTGLSSSLGLWMYQSPGIDTSHFSNGSSGVMLPGTANGATKTWIFANPDDADTYIQLKVWASTTYSNYSLGTTFKGYIDACTVNTAANESVVPIKLASSNVAQTQPTNSAQQVYLNLPFSFVFYGSSYPQNARLNFTKWLNLTLTNGVASGTSLPSTSDTNLAIPSTSAPRPGIFVFWDKVAWGPTGSTPEPGMCAKLIGNAPPNRQLAISWQKLGFSGAGPYMTIGAVLNESTDEIWFSYKTMVGASPTGGATVGAQDASGTTAALGSVSNQSTFTSGTEKVLLPLP